MIDIKNIDGSVIFSVLPDEDALFHEELMTSDYVQLSWDSDVYQVIPAGAYIEYDGEKYKLLDNYTPTQQDECTYQYTPQFQSRIMNWDKQITPVYTYGEDGTTVKSREMDWEFTGSPADAMYIVKQAIKNETGENWTIQLSDSLPATITISSQSASIFSMLNTIANECDTEWWADKKTNTLYLSKCIFGDAVKLEVGDNVQVPTVTSDSEGYFTRFYVLGSTRNITQDYNSGQATNSIVNKRLTLNPTKYPNGYKDIKSGIKPDEVFVKVLYFDDIFPSSKLTISDVRARLRYRLDNSGQRIIIGGTDEEPIYEQYAIWYFQIAGFTFNPETDVIEGLNLSASFESGQLNSRDFELTYHEKAETVSDSNDVTPFEVKAGDYEIVIEETSGQIIPGTSYIIPQDGDSVVLYNIVMPDEYVTSAQDELEKALDKAMLSYTEDNNTYQMASDPTRFYESGTDIQMGQAVTFVNGSKSLSTRVQMVEKRLDLNCYQTIKVGNKIIKGNTQQLKDEVASVNQNIDVIKAFNDLSTSLSQAYANAQREMIEGFAAIKKLWSLKEDDEGNQYAYTKLPIVGAAGLTLFAGEQLKLDSIFNGLPLDTTTLQWLDGVLTVVGGTGGASNWDELEGKPSWITTEKPKYTWSEIEQKPSWITTEKPKYSYTEITGLVEELGKYVTLSTDQSITGMKDFTDGMKVSGTLFKVVNGVLTLDCSIAVTGGITAYALGEQTAATIMDGVAVDGITITKEDGVLKVVGGGGASNWDELEGKPSWITDTKPTYAWGEITQKPTTLSGYGIQASDVLNTIKSVDGSGSGLDADTLDGKHYIDIINGNVASATKLQTARTIWGQSFDGTNNISGELNNVTNIKGRGVSIISSNILFTNNSDGKNSTTLQFTSTSFKPLVAQTNMIDLGLSNARWRNLYLGSNAYISGSTKTNDVYINGIRLYKATDGVITLEGNLAVTGGVTQFAVNEVNPSTIMDGVVVDGTSIKKENGVLKVMNAGGGEAGSVKWANVDGKPTTIAGYGITDAYTKAECDGRYVNATGDTMTGGLTVISESITTVSPKTGTGVRLAGDTVGGWIQLGRMSANPTNKVGTISAYYGDDLASLNVKISNNGFTVNENKIWHAGNDGSGSGLDADTLDGIHANGLFTSLESDTTTNLSITIGKTTKSITDLCANSAAKLQTARTIWGQSFDGTKSITGSMSVNGNITIANGSSSTLTIWDSSAYLQQQNISDLGGYGLYLYGSSGTRIANKLVVDSNAYFKGNVGIGTISPSYKLYVNGTCRVTSTSVFNGNVGIGTTSPSQKLHVAGNILATGGGTFYSSDIRAKNVIERPKLSLNSIANAPVIKFRWNGYNDLKDDGKLHIGGVAQYIEKILPECVIGQKDDFLSFDYATVGYVFSVQTARHLQSYETKTDREIKKLKNRITFLEKQLKKLGYEEINIMVD